MATSAVSSTCRSSGCPRTPRLRKTADLGYECLGGDGEVDWEAFFGTLRDMDFDGIAMVCVFGWEEKADDVHRRMLERVTSELAS